jgi:hypothetical protein
LKSLSYRDGAEALSPQSASAVQRAEEAPPEDKNVKELKEKVAALVASKFEGDYMRAFQHYAGEGGMVSRTELSTMLKDAGIGNALTRGYWVDGVMEKVDADKDQQISQSEFLNVLQ